MASGGILYYFQLGGVFMYPLLLLSILSLTLVCERYWYYRRHSLGITPLVEKISAIADEIAKAGESAKVGETGGHLPSSTDSAGARGTTEALRICAGDASVGARILEDGLRLFPAGVDRAEKGMETRARIEISRYERGLSLLAAVANLAPLLGFLGTVSGMIDAFGSIAGAESVSPQLVSGGIFESLITTAAGLIIAVPAFAFHNIFTHKVNQSAIEIESAVAALMNALLLREGLREGSQGGGRE